MGEEQKMGREEDREGGRREGEKNQNSELFCLGHDEINSPIMYVDKEVSQHKKESP